MYLAIFEIVKPSEINFTKWKFVNIFNNLNQSLYIVKSIMFKMALWLDNKN